MTGRYHRPTAEVKGLRRCAPEAKGCSDHRAIHGELGKLNAFLDAKILQNLHNLVITLHTLTPVKPFFLGFGLVDQINSICVRLGNVLYGL